MSEIDLKNAYHIQVKVDLDALESNQKAIVERKNKDAMLMNVIKADAYGHGAITLAREMEKMGSDWFAVSSIEEGIELRKHGISLPILILGFTYEGSFEDLFKYQITPTVYEEETAKRLSEVAKALGETLNIHVKIDTGMSRLGFSVSQESVSAIRHIADLEGICIQGIFTHFSCADMEGDMAHAYTKKQIDGFTWMIAELKKCGVEIPIAHCSNSAAIMEHPEVHMNMVRAGIIQYGLYPSEEVEKKYLPLMPVMELKSHISYIKELEAGIGIGYGATYVTSHRTKVATIPVGYADGYPRSLSNKGCVLIRGQRVPIIGRVCMDQMMVDVSNLLGVSIGDEVTLFGKDGDEQISVEELSTLAGSFNYEFVCDISRRVPRVYYRHGQPVSMVNYLYDEQ